MSKLTHVPAVSILYIANMPRLVDGGWSTLGEEPPAFRNVVEATRMDLWPPGHAHPPWKTLSWTGGEQAPSTNRCVDQAL